MRLNSTPVFTAEETLGGAIICLALGVFIGVVGVILLHPKPRVEMIRMDNQEVRAVVDGDTHTLDRGERRYP